MERLTNLEIREENPPNIQLILAALTPGTEACFCYGNVIYNPNGRDILPDVETHEAVHSKQQGGDPDGWWARYLTDKDFRLSQELEAYGVQYAFAKDVFTKNGHPQKTKILEWSLDKMAEALSSETYGSLISFAEAHSKIRNFNK